MNADNCNEMRLLVQADLDGELRPAEAARVSVHLDGCAQCRDVASSLQALSGRLRAELPRIQASERLRRAVAAMAEAEPPRSRTTAQTRPARRRLASAPSFAAGFALAASIALVVLLPRTEGTESQGTLGDAVVSDHIRSLQPGHLMDVASTDQHTVKPWFDGRLDFAPPVKDLKSQGFPLTGGRLDYLDRHQVAALLYGSGKHVVQLFVWPSRSTLDHSPAPGARQGYNYVSWTEGGMTFWAVSDLNAAELDNFVRLWRSA